MAFLLEEEYVSPIPTEKLIDAPVQEQDAAVIAQKAEVAIEKVEAAKEGVEAQAPVMAAAIGGGLMLYIAYRYILRVR